MEYGKLGQIIQFFNYINVFLIQLKWINQKNLNLINH